MAARRPLRKRSERIVFPTEPRYVIYASNTFVGIACSENKATQIVSDYALLGHDARFEVLR